MYTYNKMKSIVLPFVTALLFNFSFAQNEPSHFKSEIDFGNGIVFSTFLDVSATPNQFTVTSPKNADVRLFGGKAKLGRAMGKSPKKGIIITIAGVQKNDSLFGETKIPMVGKLKFKGAHKNETLSGIFLNEENTPIGTLRGTASEEDKIDYSYLYPILLKTIQDHIYSKEALQTKGWDSFQKDLEKLCRDAHDDIELYLGFNLMSQKLPFSHLSLAITQDPNDSEEPTSTQKSVVFEEKNNNTAYLRIMNFSNSQEELAAILPGIVANTHYKNLIIDLRDNGGGGIGPAFELAKHIVAEDFEVGYFVTNKLQYSGFQRELFATLPAVQPISTKAFGKELKTSPGVKLIFKKPENATFTGKLYVLTNGRTASTCEPFVYALKNSKKATIIGEKTYGGMLAAFPFVASGKYTLMLPIADFYTYDGVRLDRVGVSPDVEVTSETALDKTLELINSGGN